MFCIVWTDLLKVTWKVSGGAKTKIQILLYLWAVNCPVTASIKRNYKMKSEAVVVFFVQVLWFHLLLEDNRGMVLTLTQLLQPLSCCSHHLSCPT